MPNDIFTALVPREDVLEGTLSDAVFAASLDEVVGGTAPPAYGEPELFYAATFPSQGLKDLLNEALGRVSGGRPDASPIIRLETNLGGGKTHNLIALWHAAKGFLPPMRALEFMNPEYLPDAAVPHLAAFVGTSAGATSFPEVGGIEARTLWEYLAVQIAGEEGLALLANDDLTAPGASAIKKLLGDRPTLILIDEIARYLATAAGKTVGDSNLARQTVSFLMALMEAVDASDKASLVLTTTEVTDAFGDYTQTVLDALSEAGELIARREHVIRPSGEADLPFILSRRLFSEVPAGVAEEVGRAYGDAAGDAFAHGADLPEELYGGAWAETVANSYPWHPHLIRALDKRLSTIPNFQRTRGALRLLAGSVRHLWEHQPGGTLLVHPHHLDLVDRHTVEDLSSRLQLGGFSDLLGNLQPILGHVENAVRAVWEAPRAERAKAADDALEQIDHRIEELREHGIDLTLEDPMPVPSNPEPPVTLDQLRMLVRDHLGIEVGLPDAPASFDPKQVSRDQGSWCALATYGHPRLEGLLRQRAEESGEEDVLTLGRADVESITRTAVVRADRVPPQAVRRVDALATLGAKASDADAGREADALARDAALARLEHIREVVLRRAVRREESIRHRFIRLVRRTIESECALSHHEHGTVADPLAIWLSFGQDQTAWRYADTFRNRLDVGFDQLLPSHPADLTAMSVGQARAGHRDRTADELNQLMVEWREFESSLT